MSLKVVAGDVVFVRGQGVLQRLIRWAETEPGEEATWANHVAVVVKAGWLVPPDPSERRGLAETVEALWRVEHNRWWNRHKADKGCEVMVYRHGNMTPDQVEHVTRYAMNQVGNKYGWWKLGVHLADRLIFGGKTRLSRWLCVDKRPICSYLVARAFEVVGIGFGMPAAVATPDEQLDWCQAEPPWQRVGAEAIFWVG